MPLSWQSSRRNDKEMVPFEDGDLIISSRYKVKSFDEVKRLLNGEVVKFIYLNDENINLAGNKKFKYLYLSNNENMDEL